MENKKEKERHVLGLKTNNIEMVMLNVTLVHVPSVKVIQTLSIVTWFLA